MEERYLTTGEVADRLRTSPETIRYWRHLGKGPRGFRAGRRVLYPISEVLAWEQEQRAARPRVTPANERTGPVASGTRSTTRRRLDRDAEAVGILARTADDSTPDGATLRDEGTAAAEQVGGRRGRS